MASSPCATLLKNNVISKPAVIVVLGATGTGKSKLAIQIAQRFNGEIISADSMQVYKGLDIITNKVTPEEQSMVKHHMISLINPLHKFTVVDFRNKALPIIGDLLQKGKLPVIVGGTNYYIESLLWKVLISQEDSPDAPLLCDQDAFINKKFKKENPTYDKNSKDDMKHTDETHKIEKDNTETNIEFTSVYQTDLSKIPTSNLHKHLTKIDPEMADQLHPNNRRKIIRSLQVYEQMGISHSELLRQQQLQDGGNSLGGPLRFPNTCILWLQSRQDVLDNRLDVRVDDMIERGLIQELKDFHQENYEQWSKNIADGDYCRGIFQSIGFKEFHQYLSLNKTQQETEEAEKYLQEGIEALKLVTRQYARKQIKWITNRFLRKPDRQVPPIYGFDVTDVSLWEENVSKPALETVESFLKGNTPKLKPIETQPPLDNKEKSYYCDTCQRLIMGTLQWNVHIRSRRHKKVSEKKKIIEKNRLRENV